MADPTPATPPPAAMKPGDIVDVIVDHRTGRTRRAILSQHRPYLDRRGQLISDGWYVSWYPLPPMDESQGGWQQSRFLRRIETEAADAR